ncbi:hypothetical protein [Sphingomicrobium astaxanthinifaciens]|uniref:hypothetical protein n=1 Tax=Sphingomicrobium astaxanthinifaciens TaxID=1227949 RepID=UPI001FCC0545|nr:hypothetical protein [Sphingomicrobium astaxanthinifaciens]MCJ7420751.1 hypothetical protein [Sphingomicrobium astaxanthinifaciens]
MIHGKTTIGRAFELARVHDSIEEIRTQLKSEGYFQIDAHLSGPQIKKDLRRVIEEQSDR